MSARTDHPPIQSDLSPGSSRCLARYALLTAFVAGLAGNPAKASGDPIRVTAAAVTDRGRACDVALRHLLAKWDRARFTPPSKPGQYRVFGNGGYVTDGPQYNAMVYSIRSAANAARQGCDDVARARIDAADRILAASFRGGQVASEAVATR